MAIPPPPPVEPPQPAPPPALVVRAPKLVATGVGFTVSGRGAPARGRVAIELGRDGRWRELAAVRAGADGRFERELRPRTPRRGYRLRVTTRDGRASRAVVVRSRHVTLAAAGDVNLGDATASAMASRGLSYPWTSVGPALRGADVAFVNLECAISTRGAPVSKQYTFRGSPAALKAMRDTAGIDVVNLANNHVGDYGTAAMLDTIAWSRRLGLTTVGAGGSLAAAARPQVVERLGLKIAFVGFSNILPSEFFATASRPGTQPATIAQIRASVGAAKRVADVVIATFHWGVELDLSENGDQQAFAAAAFDAGATAVIGGHPHVLQPLRRVSGNRVVAWSLGNFVFASFRASTVRTGILHLDLSARGVERTRFQRARIDGVRPVLTGSWTGPR
ncbi:CapA family protein [Conexibacter arvalis]|uniref:Poly-gamma-glutamate capsule biosynthesis protein CapA/YwtB (Metallophosphatase superfamily) n=1 Tax=Conexibacter arvalis TaxID=912552 RepID=A0A840ICD5_9ACTN|nr:CapA family protein [Conexibacter arvalis]MBB4661891.1 poly-gamma-glutamate capsule biosynthesis protein CapA/YwtB (metallophosphatase superfamily) [Conexibacter arvalis]